MILKLLKGKQALLSTSIFMLLVVVCNIKLNAQGNSIKSGVTFNWYDTQSNEDDPATISTITINGFDYTTFAVPSTYELSSVGPAGHDENNIWLNGSRIIGDSSDPNWAPEAIQAYQSLNLNHYFQSKNIRSFFVKIKIVLPFTINILVVLSDFTYIDVIKPFI